MKTEEKKVLVISVAVIALAIIAVTIGIIVNDKKNNSNRVLNETIAVNEDSISLEVGDDEKAPDESSQFQDMSAGVPMVNSQTDIVESENGEVYAITPGSEADSETDIIAASTDATDDVADSTAADSIVDGAMDNAADGVADSTAENSTGNASNNNVSGDNENNTSDNNGNNTSDNISDELETTRVPVK